MYNANKAARYALLYGASDRTIKRTLAKTHKRMPARKRARLIKEEKQNIYRLIITGYHLI